MKKDIIEERKRLKGTLTVETYEGESIEEKCARISENNEPISDGAELVYTPRKDGVKPEYDVRTDKWDIAIDKMNKVSEMKKNKIKENMRKGLPEPESKEPESKEPVTNKQKN